MQKAPGAPVYVMRRKMEIAKATICNWHNKSALNENWFLPLADAEDGIKAWRCQHDEARPHHTGLAPTGFNMKKAEKASKKSPKRLKFQFKTGQLFGMGQIR
jgi:hypothetical protein